MRRLFFSAVIAATILLSGCSQNGENNDHDAADFKVRPKHLKEEKSALEKSLEDAKAGRVIFKSPSDP